VDYQLEAAIAAMQKAAREQTAATAASTETLVELGRQVKNIGDAARKAHEEGRKNHATLALAVRDLQRAVHGSDPPPPGKVPEGLPLDELAEQADRKASDTSLEVSALEGRMIAGFANLSKQTAEQSRAMGIGAAGARYLFSPAGRRDVVKLLALGAALVGYDQARRAPPPPTPIVVSVAPSASSVAPLPAAPASR
jgi:hypothetical protein